MTWLTSLIFLEKTNKLIIQMYKENTACVCEYDRVRIFCAAKCTHVYSMHKTCLLHYRDQKRDKIIMIFNIFIFVDIF